MAFLFPHLWEKLFGKRDERSQRRPRAAKRQQRPPMVKPWLEPLEDRTLLSTYVYTNAAPTNDHLASNPANWMVWDVTNTKWSTTNQAPGAADDMWFTTGKIPETVNGQVQQEQSPLLAAAPCIVDANFGGIVQSLHVDQNYNTDQNGNAVAITLNGNLTVTTEADINGGTVAGNGNLYIGDHPPAGQVPQYTAVLNWQGGTLGGATTSWVYINSLSSANISGPAQKTLNGRNLTNYGTVNWTGGGNIQLNNTALVQDWGTMNFQSQNAGVISSDGRRKRASTSKKAAPSTSTHSSRPRMAA